MDRDATSIGRTIGVAALALVLLLAAAPARAADTVPVTHQLQKLLDQYLKDHGTEERISGLSLEVSLGDPGPIIQVFSGNVSTEKDARPIDGDTLYQIGSNTKVFTAVLLLKLEAMGRLDIHQTVGRWLPQYPAWKDVTIDELLTMTSPIPTYDDSSAMLNAEAADITHQWSPAELVAFAYPNGGSGDMAKPKDPWFYSNTNYMLAGMIASAAGDDTYAALLKRLVIDPAGLRDTVIAVGPLDQPVLDRLASGTFANPDCATDKAPCAAMVGRDMRTNNLSWAGAAGGIVAPLRDETRWVRALFGGKVLAPAQMAELLSLVSTKTGRKIAETSAADPRGFSLGLARQFLASMGGSFWFYEGETLGYRVIFAYLAEPDLVLTLAANSQPEKDGLGTLLPALVDALRSSGAISGP